MRSLPYSIEAFFAVMEQVNQFWFPAVIVAAGLMLIAVFLITQPPSAALANSSRTVGGILAVSWVWVGAVHQLEHMADLNFMAPVYGTAWIVQGVLIAFTCVLRARVRFSVRGSNRGWVGLGIALFGLFVYPAAVLLVGVDWRAVPLAG